MNWKAVYEQAHEKYIAKNFPNAYREHGAPKVKFPKTDTSNGLTTMIKNWCLWNEASCMRVNSQGQARVEKVHLAHGNIRTNVRWTKGQSKGAADLDIVIKHKSHKFGIPIKCEIKIGNDSQRPDQMQYEKQVTAAGGVYVIIKTPEQWFNFYFNIIS